MDSDEPQPAERHAAMTWAQRLKRVFNIDIETCRECGGTVKLIACNEDPQVIKKILDYLGGNTETTHTPTFQKAGRHRLACRRACFTDASKKTNGSTQDAALILPAGIRHARWPH